MGTVTVAQTSWERLGVTVGQFVQIEVIEKRMAEYGVRDVMDEAEFVLFVEGLPEVPERTLRAVVMDCRRSRQAIDRELKSGSAE